MKTAFLAAALLVLPLAAARDDPLKGYVAGRPVNCIAPFANTGPTILDNRTIVYRETGSRMWVTHPVGTCPALRAPATLIVERFGGQLCRNDRFQVLEPGTSIPSASCRFDRFVPYRKAPARPAQPR